MSGTQTNWSLMIYFICVLRSVKCWYVWYLMYSVLVYFLIHYNIYMDIFLYPMMDTQKSQCKTITQSIKFNLFIKSPEKKSKNHWNQICMISRNTWFNHLRIQTSFVLLKHNTWQNLAFLRNALFRISPGGKGLQSSSVVVIGVSVAGIDRAVFTSSLVKDVSFLPAGITSHTAFMKYTTNTYISNNTQPKKSWPLLRGSTKWIQLLMRKAALCLS